MSAQTTIATKREFLAIVPDKPGSQQKRLELRSLHLEGVMPKVNDGTLKMGGVVLNSIPLHADPSTFDFHGSAIVTIASSREEVHQLLKDDIYAKSGVWDVEKAQIFPFVCVFRNP